MSFYYHRIPRFIQKIFPQHLWVLPNSENKIYLTFDDGPTPDVTEFVLQCLEKYQASATFFMLGEQVDRYTDLVAKVHASEHAVGNHGYKHLDGWKESKQDYEENLLRGEQALSNVLVQTEWRFRPPYGHFRRGTSVVMWTLMSRDFDPGLSKETCLSALIAKTQSGDVVVFHDNEKSFGKLQWVLPRYLKYCQDVGFEFDVIPFRP